MVIPVFVVIHSSVWNRDLALHVRLQRSLNHKSQYTEIRYPMVSTTAARISKQAILKDVMVEPACIASPSYYTLHYISLQSQDNFLPFAPGRLNGQPLGLANTMLEHMMFTMFTSLQSHVVTPQQLCNIFIPCPNVTSL